MNNHIATGRGMLKWLKTNVSDFNPDIFLVQSKGSNSRVPAIIIQNGKLVEVWLPTYIAKLTEWIPRFEEYFQGLRFTDKDYVSFSLDGNFVGIFECDWKERHQISARICESAGLDPHDRRVVSVESPRPKTWKTIADV